MKAPFPYFGGKSMVANQVWKALGQPDHYIEPFFGSGAVLLNRPNFDPRKYTETVNDADGYLCNVWRAIQFDPNETAKWCDWPVNHADLIARKARLIREKNYLLENLCKDEKWFDSELAAYWIWAASCWIGSGLTRPGQKRPHLANKGIGVHAIGQIPYLSNKGMGVHATKNDNIYKWFNNLSQRLRYVRVVCGDWTRVCGGDWQDKGWSDVGIFFDPPYAVEDRDDVYDTDSKTVGVDVRKWAIERGNRSNYKIVYAGYDSEGEELVAAGWEVLEWKTSGGYGKTSRNGKETLGQTNRHRERLWFSPYCKKLQKQRDLFSLDKS